MLKSYKYRIMPSDAQKEIIEHHFGCCRLVWNLALAAKIAAYDANKTNVSRYDLQKQLLDLKKEYSWLYGANAQSLQSVLLNLDSAYKNFFRKGGFPKFKSKKGRQSFQCPQAVSLTSNLLRLPKIGVVKIVLSREFKGKIKTVTISKTPTNKYFASILVDNGNPLPIKQDVIAEKTIGIDVGIKSFVVTSDGRYFLPNRFFKKNIERLKVLQRRNEKKKKGSCNRKKSSIHISNLYEKIKNQRLDYIHKITTQIIRDNQVDSFVIEDLNVSGMMRNRKLSQAVSDVSWANFFEILKYKCEWYGKNLIKINRFTPSSKRCNSCGSINNELSLSDRKWKCQTCNSVHDRDENAAKNIKHFGLLNKLSPEGIREEPVELRRLRRTKKQEDFT